MKSVLWLLGGFLIERHRAKKRKQLRDKLARDLKSVDQMDLTNPEKKALKKDILKQIRDLG